jgi:glycosyltransferase involved in cell wall biosynthesis
MKALIVHQNFPGQYLHLARFLGASAANKVVFITQHPNVDLPGVKKVIYKPKRGPAKQTHHYLRDTESAVLNAQEVTRCALALKQSGFAPDVMLGHNGWGEIWYLKEVFPNVPLIGYFEFFYRYEGADIEFQPSVSKQFDTAPRVRTKNIGNLLGLDAVDLGQCPTRWQRSLYPERYHSMLHVVHEGIDTRAVAPNPQVRLNVPEVGRDLTVEDEVITYVARNLEPYRGFEIFMRSLPAILSRRPRARVVIIGGDGVSYGQKLPEGKTFRAELLKELGDSLDTSRVHFLGKVPYPTFLSALQISSAHVYLTYPFVLSWSMLEAMAAGCAVVGSKTPPVQEVLRHQDNGVLVDFFSISEIVDAVVDMLARPADYQRMRARARQTIVDSYDLHTIALPAQLKLLREVAEPSKSFLWKRG